MAFPSIHSVTGKTTRAQRYRADIENNKGYQIASGKGFVTVQGCLRKDPRLLVRRVNQIDRLVKAKRNNSHHPTDRLHAAFGGVEAVGGVAERI